MPVVTAPVSHVSPQEAARMLHIPQRQLLTWQRLGLLQRVERFSLRELARIRSLRTLQQRLSTRTIRSSTAAMKRILGEDDPLSGSLPVASGSRLMFRHGGALLDPLTQQFAFDFERVPGRTCTLQSAEAPHGRRQKQNQMLAQQIFVRAVRLEEKPEQVNAAAELYRKALQLWPGYASACINLGTILYNTRQFQAAEEQYRRAAEIDPDYALAFFDLGNVLDELSRLPEAIGAYQRAVQLVPRYADAHYNLALAYERMGERRRALRHWLHYVRLDPVSPWATHARMQVRRALASEKLSIVTRHGRLA